MSEIEELNRNFIRSQGDSHGRAKLARGQGVFQQASQFISKARENIAVLTYAERPPAPSTFAEQIRDHLLEHDHISFEVVIAANVRKAGRKFWAESDARFQIYEASGLEDRLIRWVLDTNVPTGFDVIIIDQKHVCLAFSPFPLSKQDTKHLALFFENAGDFARGLSLWFHALKLAAKPYEICRQRMGFRRHR